MKLDELKALCRTNGLGLNGNKAELVAKLQSHGITAAPGASVQSSNDDWRPVEPPTVSCIVSLEDFANLAIGDFRTSFVKPVFDKISRILTESRKLHPNASVDSILAAYLGDSLWRHMISNSNMQLNEKSSSKCSPLTSVALSETFGNMLALN